MDNNLPTNQPIQADQTQVPTPPVLTQTPVPPIGQQPSPQMPPQQAAPAKKSHLMTTLLILIAFSLIVILSVYIYLSFFSNKPQDSSSVQIENTISPAAPTVVKNADEEELNNIDVGNVDDDLKDIDADLQQL
ncbi:MAG: hypothetical protein A3D74_04360 [Candidatus Levybacteria bacterium RIFCSPHIGHO2_02_FULL_37_13]|nr:MAG: hypothetical protein A3D74_04360 [Candidatus Levybacteria bacterium RIFCSPHIGHO2_02_FULL_37_13]OGH30606.1 MAG: hypothetical protein A3E40_01655 [Candidatus Levybacteria bacterium RIFCSPHIGHO2_12_FULL_37_9]OGH40536.1 MAG: hypothetical protein A3B41_02870 [Candidatus Levybacteria bacterium RIFCSPLOWO2_01_FULL_37_26]